MTVIERLNDVEQIDGQDVEESWNVWFRTAQETLSISLVKRQSMSGQRNMAALRFNHCGNRKAIRVTYSECLSLTLNIQHENLMSRIAVCGLSGYTIIFYIIS
jgi:hypothetical protein